MENPVMRQIDISLINCKSNIIEMEPASSLFLPIFGESRVTKTNTPALCEWAIGARIIDVTTSNGEFIHEDVHIKNALRQPSSLQYFALKKHIKPSFRDIYKSAGNEAFSRIIVPLTFMAELCTKQNLGAHIFTTS